MHPLCWVLTPWIFVHKNLESHTVNCLPFLFGYECGGSFSMSTWLVCGVHRYLVKHYFWMCLRVTFESVSRLSKEGRHLSLCILQPIGGQKGSNGRGSTNCQFSGAGWLVFCLEDSRDSAPTPASRLQAQLSDSLACRWCVMGLPSPHDRTREFSGMK